MIIELCRINITWRKLKKYKKKSMVDNFIVKLNLYNSSPLCTHDNNSTGKR